MNESLRVLHAASECFPLAKTGGLGDVTGALPSALRKIGAAASVALPAYRGVAAKLGATEVVAEIEVPGARFTVRRGALSDGLPVDLFDAPALFDRAGGPYVDEKGRDFDDNAFRFGSFAAALAAYVRQGAGGLAPEIVHLHDWQAALAAPHLCIWPSRPKLVFTIHNLAYQGHYGREDFDRLLLPAAWWNPQALEFWGGYSSLKAGLVFSDAITTVSPNYAREILTPEYGCGLEGVLAAQAQKLRGIVNGIDPAIWNPATDAHLTQRYDARTVAAGKRANRAAVSKELGLVLDETRPLAVFIGRLAHQKGADLLLAAGEALWRLPIQIAVLASGDPALEAGLRSWAERAPKGQVAVCIAHDEALAHRLTAAADLQLMPSRFEPCGLNQLYAQAYGTIPVVRRTGGLADTVMDATATNLGTGVATGVQFEHADAGGLLWGIERGAALWNDLKLRTQLQAAGMASDWSWQASAREYVALYRHLLGR